MNRTEEIQHKLTQVRHALHATGAAACHLRDPAWCAWITAGCLHPPPGTAEVIITPHSAHLITDPHRLAHPTPDVLPVLAHAPQRAHPSGLLAALPQPPEPPLPPLLH